MTLALVAVGDDQGQCRVHTQVENRPLRMISVLDGQFRDRNS
jgi:hypothetical protein